MKSDPRTLVAAAVLFGLFTAGADARADSKKECAAAYEKTQSLREIWQLRDARKQAVACSASTCSGYVTRDCTRWLAEIDALLPTVLLTAVDGAGATTRSARVTIDGQLITEELNSEAVPLDPGEHVVRFEMVGADAVEQKVVIRQGEKDRKLAASFERAPPPRSPSLLPAALLPPKRALPKPDTAPQPASDSAVDHHPGGIPVWAWISGGAGLVALGLSAGFGVSALNAQSMLVSRCGGDPARCPVSTRVETVPLADQRTLDRNVFLGSGAAAMVGLGVAAIGIVTTPGEASIPRTSFVLVPFGSPSGGGVEMHGQF